MPNVPNMVIRFFYSDRRFKAMDAELKTMSTMLESERKEVERLRNRILDMEVNPEKELAKITIMEKNFQAELINLERQLLEANKNAGDVKNELLGHLQEAFSMVKEYQESIKNLKEELTKIKAEKDTLEKRWKSLPQIPKLKTKYGEIIESLLNTSNMKPGTEGIFYKSMKID